jgi:hypothetical protein
VGLDYRIGPGRAKRVARCRARGPGAGRGRPSVPAIQATGYGPFCQALREVTEPLNIPGAGIRIASEPGWITVELRTDDS